MKTAKKVASIVVSVVMWVIILLAALYAFTTLATKEDGSVANIAGFTPLAVQSESMSPTFEEGDLIIIQACDTSTLQAGDIITFHTIVDNKYALNTHRIDSIAESNGARSYTTKGDNNAVTDQHIISDVDIVGKYVVRLPYMGNVMNFLSSSTGFLVVIVIPMLLFFIYQVYHLIIVGMNLKRAMAAEDRMAQAEAIVDGQVAAGVAGAASAGSAQGASSDDLARAEAARADAEAKLAEAKRLKAEAEAALAASNGAGAAGNSADSQGSPDGGSKNEG